MAEISLRLPFNGDFPVTFEFGATSENEEIKKKFSEWGIVGHNGIDYGLPEGTEVVTSADGKVIQSGDNGDFGNSITIQHPWGQSFYAHLKETKVSQDQEVKASDSIGLSGQTGAAFGEHLHFGIKQNDSDVNNGYLGFVDPSPYFGKQVEKPMEPQEQQTTTELPKTEEQKVEASKPVEEQKPSEGVEPSEEARPVEERPQAESPQSPEPQVIVKEVVKEVPVEKEIIKEVIKEVPIVNQEEMQKQITERLKVEQDERRKLANEARAKRKTDNLNRILEFVRERKVVANDDVRDYLHISQSTATNYLSELVNRGMLKREGERGGTKYSV